MKKTFVLFWIIISHYLLLSQNLVLNPDVSKTSKMISDVVDNNKGLKGFGTVDFYHPSAGKFFPWLIPPNIHLGYANPKCGNSFAGFGCYFFKDSDKNYFVGVEHIQFSLTDTLKKDKSYTISFYIKLANQYYASNTLGVLFSKDSNFVNCGYVKYQNRVEYVDCYDATSKADIEIMDSRLLIDTSWTEVKTTYKAQGGERYMTIGLFWQDNPKIIKAYKKAKNKSNIYWLNIRKKARLSKVMKRELLVKNPYKIPPTTQWSFSNERGAYYFIDCVSVEEIKD
jgi:hypothetical protein